MAELPRAFGPYILLKALGTSGTSNVFLARTSDPNRGLPTPLVIKSLRGELTAQDEFYSRFMHEAQIAVSAQCPHLPQVYDVGRVGDSVYIAMEYLTGWTIARLISDLHAAGKEASIESVGDVICGALTALAALHGAVDKESGQPLGIVHRDIAPKNVMVGEDGVTRLIDFGLGKSKLEEWKTETGVVLGTPGYMAPEQVQAHPVDQRADVYAMGIVAWELLTLRSYIRRGPVPLMLRAQATPTYTPPSTIRAGVPKELDQVLAKALASNPDQRFQNARQFFDAMRAAVPNDLQDPLPTLVGEMLWGELDQEKSHVTQLVKKSALGGGAPSEPRIVELTTNQRQGSNPQGYGEEAYANTTLSSTLSSDPHLVQQVIMEPTPSSPNPMLPPLASPLPMRLQPERRGGVRIEIVLALIAATLVFGVTVGILLRDGGGGSQNGVTTVSAPSAEEEPSAAPIPAVAPAVRAEEKLPPLEQPKEIVRTTKSGIVVKTPAKTIEPAPAPAAPAVSDENPKERANALIKRAKTVKQKLTAGSAEASRATSLINQLAMEASSSETSGAKLKELEGELAKLEAAAH